MATPPADAVAVDGPGDARRPGTGTVADPTPASAGPAPAVPPRDAPPSDFPPAEAPPPDDAAREAALRRVEARRSWRPWLLAPIPLAVLLWADHVPVFLATVAILQVVAWPVFAGARRRPARPGAAVLSATPEGKAWMFLLWSLVVGALFVDVPAVRLLVSCVFATVAGSAPAVRANAARAFLERDVERRARAGAPTTVVWRLRNPTPRPAVEVVVRDRLGLGAVPAAADLVFDAVPAGGTAEAETTVVHERRGRRRYPPALVSSRFPLGLFSVAYETAAPAETLVHPREGRASPALLARLRGAADASGRAVSRRPGIDHFHGLREWREGDDPRRVHWRTSARRGRRTFMEWRDEETRRVTVVLGAGPGKGPEADRRFDRAVSAVATVARAARRARLPARVVLGAAGEPAAGMACSDARRHEAALDALALVRADAPRRPEACLEEDAGVRGTVVVWVSSRAEPAVEEALRRLEARGGRVLRLKADDSLARWVRGLP